MVYKLLKKSLIICMCFASLTPYANSTNVSDGSAFITKSELSYELNSLSNRMTQLENSLDSRIDTLVSSYLTRNGIWNGDNQVLQNNIIIDCSGYDISGSNANMIYSTKFPSDLAAGDVVVFKQESKKLVNNISKIGLCHLAVNLTEIGQSIAQDHRTFTHWNFNNGEQAEGKSWNLFHIDGCNVRILNNDTEVARFKQYATNFEQIQSDRIIMMKVVPATMNLYFFVNKGDKLYYEYNVGVSIMSLGCALGLRGKQSVVGGAPASLKCEFLDCSVY